MVQVQLPLPQRPVGQAVKTPPFHGGNMGSIPVRVTMIDCQKRYYAHKRLCKAICGHKSCEKQDCCSVDIFDTKMDSNSPEKNINKIFQSVVVYIAQMPVLVTDFSALEAENKEWLAEEGKKLINSGKGIDTEYGKLFVNDNIPFEEIFKGTALPPYYCDPNAVVSVEVSYNGETELIDLPNEDIAIKRALTRLGANDIGDCEITIDGYCDITDELREKIKIVENTKGSFLRQDSYNRSRRGQHLRLHPQWVLSQLPFPNDLL